MISRLLEYNETVDINDFYHRFLRNGENCSTVNYTGNFHEWGVEKSDDILNAKCDKERMPETFLHG